MADKQDYNDDYQFADPDSPGTDPFENPSEESIETRQALETEKRSHIIRNAVIAVIIFILAVLLYKFFTSRSTTPVVKAPPAQLAPPKPVVQAPSIVQPALSPQPVEIQGLESKINTLDLNQQNLRTDVISLSNQLNSLNTNISDMNAQIAKLSQTVETLSVMVSQQANTITMIETRLEKPKPVAIKHRRVYSSVPAPIFYIKAVVPGRAWIISTRGTTLTVREGSSIPGYGIVKLIDAQQGRILTGSGRVIKFSQEDS